ncbi:MAG: Gfo/Idh/MocA family oxidoreductase [Anaerolineae bacterium]|nr:Gfo/Idh/MocA family oxidoreductase [Anaerolineae bacterium]
MTTKVDPQPKESSTNGTLRYALIGAGGVIAATHLNALAQQPGAQVVGLADIDPTRAEPRAKEVGAPYFKDHREMLRQLQPDVAVICTPHPSHTELVIDSLDAGAHVLIEKPMTIEVAQADAIVAAADAVPDRTVAVNFQHRFRPVVERMKALIDSGMLGSLVRVVCTEPWFRTDYYYRVASWRGTWQGEAGGVLMNQAPHPLDLLCYLGGLPDRVLGRIQTVAHNIETEDRAQAMLEYANGASGYLQIDTIETGERRMEIVGDKAALELNGSKLTIRRFTPSLSECRTTSQEMFGSPTIAAETLDLPGDAGAHIAVYKDFHAAVLEKRPPRCDPRGARMSVELANAVTLSSLTQRMVSLPLDRAEYSALLADLRAGRRSLR